MSQSPHHTGGMPLPGPRDPLWERQFAPEDLICFQKRGGRLPQEEWLKQTYGRGAAVIAYYERATGIPFCVADQDELLRALVLTSLPNVCRAIRQAAAWPPERPGFFLIKSGFVVVTNLIDRNPRLWSRGKNSGGVVSGYTPEITDIIRRRNRKYSGPTAGTVGPENAGVGKQFESQTPAVQKPGSPAGVRRCRECGEELGDDASELCGECETQAADGREREN